MMYGTSKNLVRLSLWTNALLLLLYLVCAAKAFGAETLKVSPNAPRLTAEQQHLLEGVSSEPKTALDYYMLLPNLYFGAMPDSPEWRVAYVDQKSLTNNYLSARRWREMTADGFTVSLKIYRAHTGVWIVIKQEKEEMIFGQHDSVDGEPSIGIFRPVVWRYASGRWLQQSRKLIPKIAASEVFTHYRHSKNAGPEKYGPSKMFTVDYKISAATDDIVLMGRGNYQDGIYEYGRLNWTGSKFTFRQPHGGSDQIAQH